MAKQPATRSVQCYHCRHRFDVGAMTQSTVCASCNKSLVVHDLVVKTLQSVRKIQTCGKLHIQKKGHVIAQLVEAIEGVDVEGVIDAKVISAGPVRIAAKAQWKGDCRAPVLVTEPGCIVTGGFFEILKEPENGEGPPSPEAPKETRARKRAGGDDY